MEPAPPISPSPTRESPVTGVTGSEKLERKWTLNGRKAIVSYINETLAPYEGPGKRSGDLMGLIKAHIPSTQQVQKEASLTIGSTYGLTVMDSVVNSVAQNIFNVEELNLSSLVAASFASTVESVRNLPLK